MRQRRRPRRVGRRIPGGDLTLPPLPGPAPTRPASGASALRFRVYGIKFHRAPLLARLWRRSNGEIVSAADGSQENGLGRGSGEIGPGETRQAWAARSGSAAGGARPLRAWTAAHDQAPASSPDAASLLRRRLLHKGHARDAQPRHLFPQVSARACWHAKVHVLRHWFYPLRGATIAHALSSGWRVACICIGGKGAVRVRPSLNRRGGVGPLPAFGSLSDSHLPGDTKEVAFREASVSSPGPWWAMFTWQG